MIVGVSGFGYTGSGAVFGYLKERDECDAINTESVSYTHLMLPTTYTV